jgi:hypothetical protein
MCIPLLVVVGLPQLDAFLWLRISKMPGMVKPEEAACGVQCCGDALGFSLDFSRLSVR